MAICWKLKLLPPMKWVMSNHTFQGIIKNMDSAFRLHVTMNQNLYLSVLLPQVVDMIFTLQKTVLNQWVQNLSFLEYIIGDNAYICSKHLLTPYPYYEKDDHKRDAYNLYISQIRMRIEMAFGMMIEKNKFFGKCFEKCW